MIENNKLKNLKGVDVIFFSAFDHNEGKNNHGLFQMFDFFREKVNVKSIFVNTLESLYKNNTDIFDISYLGETIPLSHQINFETNFTHRDNPNLWSSQYKDTDSTKKKYIEHASKVLIENLPEHKFIAIADKADIDLSILEMILKHFKSKVIILSAVNNTWTGHCAYPDEYNCDKFKTKTGCSSPCPALAQNNNNENFVSLNYNATKDFVTRNKKSIVLNVGNKFSLQESSESYIFKDVEKILIPLKNVFSHDNFEKLWLAKEEQRRNLINNLKQNSSLNVDNVNFIAMWSAHDIAIKRKGMDYFITSLKILKYLMKASKLDQMLVIVSAQIGDNVFANELKKLNIPIVFTGHVDKNTYNSILAASDVYCSTTLSDAGPRTTYESAALATPVISFDKCNASDFVNKEIGALIETYDVKSFAEEMHRFAIYNKKQKKEASFKMHQTYKDLMDTDKLVNKWEDFFKKHGV